nr:unnamed protein product [Spirometra erinaceieuropaei]
MLKTDDGVELYKDDEKAEHLSKFFQSVFTREVAVPTDHCNVDNVPTIDSVVLTKPIVQQELLKLKEGTSPGPDELPAKLLKELATELAEPLFALFQASLDAGRLPPEWKTAWISPIHKNGSRASANYRPTRAIDEGNVVHVAYIDFKKAFDSVPHQRLLHKLSRIGVRGKLLKWIENFLVGRSQTVRLGGQQSAEVTVTSGVPQGSVLDPILFLIYIYDCIHGLDCKIAMFADDIKLWTVIRNEVDEANLQANLDRLEKWAAKPLDAYRDERPERRIPYRTDGHLNSRRMQAPARLFADDCGLNTTTEADVWQSIGLFATRCANFGLTINANKTAVMHQP